MVKKGEVFFFFSASFVFYIFFKKRGEGRGGEGRLFFGGEGFGSENEFCKKNK